MDYNIEILFQKSNNGFHLREMQGSHERRVTSCCIYQHNTILLG